MKTIEALISAMALLAFLQQMMLAASLPPQPYGPGLYRMQLAEDAWRIMYLRGCFNQSTPSPRVFPSTPAILSAFAGNSSIAGMIAAFSPDPVPAKDPMEACLNGVIAEIEAETGLKVEFEDMDAAGSSRTTEGSAKIRKTIIVNGIPERVSLSLG